MSPIYAARITLVKAETDWRIVDRDLSSGAARRRTAREAYERAKAAYRASFKQARAERA